jgi:hypothetical protein
MSPEEDRVIAAVERLMFHGRLIYSGPRGDDTPIPTCAGCGVSDWIPDRIEHRPDCAVTELIAAVRALNRE